MDILLSTIALFTIVIAGCGIALLLLPRGRSISAIELVTLSLLQGVLFISLTSFILGFFITGPGLKWTITVLCLAIFAIGWRKKPEPFYIRWEKPDRIKDWGLLGLMLMLIGLVIWLTRLRVLGWDGLLNWEIKARVAYLHGGAIPLSFFSDPTRIWSHPEYPLLLPLTESWLYIWLGRADQEWVKILFPLFYAALLGLLYLAVSRFGNRSAQVWLLPFMLVMVRILVGGEGGASSGYADLPMAVFYLAAVMYLLEYWLYDDVDALRTFSFLAGALCWIKREGAILWFCLIVLASIKIIGRREIQRLITTILPGLLLLSGWRIFISLVNPPVGKEFLALTPTTLKANLWRTTVIAEAVLAELLNWRHWGILWLLAPVAALLLLLNAHRRELLILPLAVFAPVILYSLIFILSAWGDYLLHLNNSFPRLLLQVTPAAMMLVAIGLPIGRPRAYQIGRHIDRQSYRA